MNALDSSNAINRSNYRFPIVPDEEDNRGLLMTFVLLTTHIKGALSQDQNARPAFAQTLVDTVAAKHHPDLIYLGLRLTPQSSPDAIIQRIAAKLATNPPVGTCT